MEDVQFGEQIANSQEEEEEQPMEQEEHDGQASNQDSGTDRSSTSLRDLSQPGRMMLSEENEQRKEMMTYEVGEFVAAAHDEKWIIAQVDIDQDHAGDTHVNLSCMEYIRENTFKWPNNHNLILTKKEDILTRCSPPILVGKSIRAFHVGLQPCDVKKADAALAKVFYLQLFLYLNFFISPVRFFFSWILRVKTDHKKTFNFNILIFANEDNIWRAEDRPKKILERDLTE
jgi:hypothetical protein